jgi:hypothetical protein
MIGLGVFTGGGTAEPRAGVEFRQAASAGEGRLAAYDTRDLTRHSRARSLPGLDERHVRLCGVPKVGRPEHEQVCSAGPVPLYGTCVIVIPACCSSIAPVTCCSEPFPTTRS